MKTNHVILCVVTFVVLVAGCANKSTGVPYEEAVQLVEDTLTSRIDNGIFGYASERNDEGMECRFIEGSRLNKVDHAFPLRITVAIMPEEGGRDSSIAVDALKQELKLRHRDRDAENRWQGIVERCIREEQN